MFELAFCVAGIYTCFLSWGIYQERLSTTAYRTTTITGNDQGAEKFGYFVFLNFSQAVLACMIALIYLKVVRNKTLTWPSNSLFREYSLVALLGSLASPFGYESLKHVDYPTMILAKSCKLVPVMLMGIILHRARFEWYKYVSVILITVGVSAFALFQPSKSTEKKSNSAYGLLLLAVNLLIDGATNASQDNIFKRYRVNGPEMMFFMNCFSALFMFLYLATVTPFLGDHGTSELVAAVKFISSHPTSIYDILLFGLAGSCGQIFIFYTLEKFGSLVLVTVNVTRKMFSILLSVFWFDHRLSPSQWISVATVFVALGLETLMSKRKVSPSEKVAVESREESVTIEKKRDGKTTNRRKGRTDK